MGSFRLIIFLLMAFMIVVTFSQRGGGGRSRGGSRGGRGKGSIFKALFGKVEEQQDCKKVKGKTRCKKKQEESSGWTELGMLGIYLGYVIYNKIDQNKQEKEARLKQQAKITQYQTMHTPESARVSLQQKRALIAQFKRMKYTITFNTKDKSDRFICQLSDILLSVQTQHKFKIKMKGKDDVGSSTFNGFLMFKSRGLRMLLSKQYNNREKAGQTGQYRILLYKGQGTPKKLQGQWAYQGLQSSDKYSGDWTMLQAKNQ